MENIKITLRNELPEDYDASEELTRDAFWNHYAPGCDEHYLLHIMRNDASFVKELSFVAEVNKKLVGHIAYAMSKIVGDDGNVTDVLTFGPISVLPEYQGRGIGSALVEHTKGMAQAMGYKAILIYGDPDYYCRFGFVPAQTYGICTSDNMYAAALQALELVPDALKGISGRFEEGKVYEISEDEAMAFDEKFPYKERKNDLPSQARFFCLASLTTPMSQEHV